ncbi:MAG TPA: VWA domain-containing protein [Candidatus Paceibacterota bacterium]|nr:VWA domain-containing protein [Candidatus Paceibacterota bacterium]
MDVIRLDVVVLDKQRRPVSGLTARDFNVLDDGISQPVEAFAEVRLPDTTPVLSAQATRTAVSDVFSNVRSEDGRLVAIMMDHSVPAGGMTTVARRIARAAVASLGPNDLAAIVTSSPFRGDGKVQGFTSDRERLYRAIESPIMGVTPGPPNGPSGGSDSIPSISNSIACHCGVCQWDAIARVADAMAQETRRQKMLLFVARELKVQVASSNDVCAFDVKYARERGMQALDRANVTVHVIDPSGLESLAATASGMSRTDAAVNLARQGDLAVLPDYTGGRAIIGVNEPEKAIPAIFEETSSYYLLGFVPKRGAQSARRSIRVTVKNGRNFIVRTRTGYYPPSALASKPVSLDRLEAQVTSLLPPMGLPLTMSLTPTILSGGRTGIVLQLGMDLRNGVAMPQSQTLGVLVAVLDRAGRLLGSVRETVRAQPNESDGQLEWVSHFPQKPGEYEVRVGVDWGGRLGGVYGYVDIPDPPKSVETLVGARLAIQGVPTLRRTFAIDESVQVLFDLFQKEAPRPAVVEMIVVEDGGHEVFRAVAPPSRTIPITIDVPVSRLREGRYVLRLSLAEGDDRQALEVPFSVR